jgi:hypothetical protein
MADVSMQMPIKWSVGYSESRSVESGLSARSLSSLRTDGVGVMDAWPTNDGAKGGLLLARSDEPIGFEKVRSQGGQADVSAASLKRRE